MRGAPVADCGEYIVPAGFQLQSGGATGPVDCTAWAASRAIGHATCGAKLPSGRTIRLLSNEPQPETRSPGLNLPQVAAVARDDFGVYLDVRIGYRKVTWAEYERRRQAGQGAIIQVRYAPIADSAYDAGRGFRGNHAIFESVHATIDSLADGRYAGCFRYNGTVYQREVMKRAAGLLDIGDGTKPGYGYVWAAFTRDVIPSYRAVVPAGQFFVYTIENGVIKERDPKTTGGFGAHCTAPRAYWWSGKGYYTLVRLTSGSRAGLYISAKYAKEYP